MSQDSAGLPLKMADRGARPFSRFLGAGARQADRRVRLRLARRSPRPCDANLRIELAPFGGRQSVDRRRLHDIAVHRRAGLCPADAQYRQDRHSRRIHRLSIGRAADAAHMGISPVARTESSACAGRVPLDETLGLMQTKGAVAEQSQQSDEDQIDGDDVIQQARYREDQDACNQ